MRSVAYPILSFAAAVSLMVTSGCVSSPWSTSKSSEVTASDPWQPPADPSIQPVGYDQPLPGETTAVAKDEEFKASDLLSPRSTYNRLTGNAPNRQAAKKLLADAQAIYDQAAKQTGSARVDGMERAAAMFQRAAERAPGSDVRERGLYMYGECLFFLDEYANCNEHFELLLKEYPNTKFMDIVQRRRFKIAEFWRDHAQQDPESIVYVNVLDEERPWRDTRGHSLRLFDRIRIDDPTGDLADDATMAAGNMHFTAGKFSLADEFYTDLRKAFPSSEHQFDAHFLGLKTKLLSYQGPDYSGHALGEAERLIKQINTHFPKDAEANREYLDRSMAEVRYRQAERLWHRAEYREARGENRSARMHYQQIIADFVDTPFADKAAAQMQKIGGAPDLPEERLGWLQDMFPRHTGRAKPLIETSPTGSFFR